MTPKHDPDSLEVKDLVRRLRAELPRGSLVGGDTATQVDFNHAILGSLWKIGVWILLATFLLLTLMLRAPLLALQAVLANILSVGAALGILTLIKVTFAGSDGYVDTVTIPVIMAVVFGLSMDYEVFLLSRIRERHLAGVGTQRRRPAGHRRLGPDDHRRRARHGRRLPLLRADRRPGHHRDRRRRRRRDRPRRDARPPRPRPRGDDARRPRLLVVAGRAPRGDDDDTAA